MQIKRKYAERAQKLKRKGFTIAAIAKRMGVQYGQAKRWVSYKL